MDPLQDLKGIDAGKLLALIKKLGGRENFDAVLRDEKVVTLQDALRLLFDKNGWRRPHGLQAKVCDPNEEFLLCQPKLNDLSDVDRRIMRLNEFLCPDNAICIHPGRFWGHVEYLQSLIRKDPQIANILNGVWLPVFLPKLTLTDHGEILEQYLEAAQQSYSDCFRKKRTFCNDCKGSLANRVLPHVAGRHNQLSRRMLEGPVIGIHFPDALQGYSTEAALAQMRGLPEGFVLSGFDTIIAMAMYPDVLARDFNVPDLKLSAFGYESPGVELVFESRATELIFFDRTVPTVPRGTGSNGLLFICPNNTAI